MDAILFHPFKNMLIGFGAMESWVSFCSDLITVFFKLVNFIFQSVPFFSKLFSFFESEDSLTFKFVCLWFLILNLFAKITAWVFQLEEMTLKRHILLVFYSCPISNRSYSLLQKWFHISSSSLYSFYLIADVRLASAAAFPEFFRWNFWAWDNVEEFDSIYSIFNRRICNY